uniref:Uncharacterized protein n=1 Tax=Ditylum brightwellii TaxID=49249 RepID=A0A7S4SHL9_9STRA
MVFGTELGTKQPIEQITVLSFQFIVYIVILVFTFLFAWAREAFLSRSPQRSLPSVIFVHMLICGLLPSIRILLSVIFAIELKWSTSDDINISDFVINTVAPSYIYYGISAVILAIIAIIWKTIHHHYEQKKNKSKTILYTKADTVAVPLAFLLMQATIVIVEQLDASIQPIVFLAFTSAALALFCFFTLFIWKVQEIQNQDENERNDRFSQSLTPVNIYQDASLDPISLFRSTLVFFTQVVLINLYIGSLEGIDKKILEAGLFNFFVASLAVIVYAMNSNVAQDVRDIIEFWGPVFAFHWDPDTASSRKTRFLLILPFSFDVIVNVFSVVAIAVPLPLQLLTSESTVDFLLNLVAIFYVIELDDFLPSEEFKLQHSVDAMEGEEGDGDDDNNDSEVEEGGDGDDDNNDSEVEEGYDGDDDENNNETVIDIDEIEEDDQGDISDEGKNTFDEVTLCLTSSSSSSSPKNHQTQKRGVPNSFMTDCIKSDNGTKKKSSSMNAIARLIGLRAGKLLHDFGSVCSSAQYMLHCAVEDVTAYYNALSSSNKCLGLSTATAKLQCDDFPEVDVLKNCTFEQSCSYGMKIPEQEAGRKQQKKDEAEIKDMHACDPTMNLAPLNQGIWQKRVVSEELLREGCSLCLCDAPALMYLKEEPVVNLLDDARVENLVTEYINITRQLLSFGCNTHDVYAPSLVATTVTASAISRSISRSSYCEMGDHSEKISTSLSFISINLNDITKITSLSLQNLFHDGYSASVANGTRYCLIVSPPLCAGGFKSCLQGIGQSLDRQAWAGVVHNMKAPNGYLVDAPREANFSSYCPSNDELRKQVCIVAEGDNALQHALCSLVKV